MRTLTLWFKVILICCILSAVTLQAGEIVLKSGERFTSDKIWKENGKIRFNMHGLIVSVDPVDVVSIRGTDNAAARQTQTDKTGAPPAAPGPAKQASDLNRPISKPASKTARRNEPPSESAPGSPRVKGIGIDGIEWQMRPANIPGIEKIKTDSAYGGIDQYARTEGHLKMGKALLDGLVFSFWQNRLYTITIWVDGKPGYKRLQQAVFHRYGTGDQNKAGLEKYVWLEDSTDRLLEFDKKLNTGIFWMRSRELDRHVKHRYPD